VSDAVATPSLSAEEARVLGALMEKERTTPDVYPLTLNALRLACSQTSSRNPVMSYDEDQVADALATLRQKGLARVVHSPSGRAPKYRQVADEAFGLDPKAAAVVCLLLLRGPQSAGELRTRSERLANFDTVDDVSDTLNFLASHGLVRQLDRRPGQKDVRYGELLTGRADDQAPSSYATGGTTSRDGQVDELADRVERLEQTLAEVQADVAALRSALGDV
jgi:hypothetical protein